LGLILALSCFASTHAEEPKPAPRSFLLPETAAQQAARYRLRDAWRACREKNLSQLQRIATAAEYQAAREAYAALTGQSAAFGRLLLFPRQTQAEIGEEKLYEEDYRRRYGR